MMPLTTISGSATVSTTVAASSTTGASTTAALTGTNGLRDHCGSRSSATSVTGGIVVGSIGVPGVEPVLAAGPCPAISGGASTRAAAVEPDENDQIVYAIDADISTSEPTRCALPIFIGRPPPEASACQAPPLPSLPSGGHPPFARRQTTSSSRAHRPPVRQVSRLLPPSCSRVSPRRA